MGQRSQSAGQGTRDGSSASKGPASPHVQKTFYDVQSFLVLCRHREFWGPTAAANNSGEPRRRLEGSRHGDDPSFVFGWSGDCLYFRLLFYQRDVKDHVFLGEAFKEHLRRPVAATATRCNRSCPSLLHVQWMSRNLERAERIYINSMSSHIIMISTGSNILVASS